MFCLACRGRPETHQGPRTSGDVRVHGGGQRTQLGDEIAVDWQNRATERDRYRIRTSQRQGQRQWQSRRQSRRQRQREGEKNGFCVYYNAFHVHSKHPTHAHTPCFSAFLPVAIKSGHSASSPSPSPSPFFSSPYRVGIYRIPDQDSASQHSGCARALSIFFRATPTGGYVIRR